ncbi:outer membrane beta-barrel protein [Pseudoflavitalea sp. X16]|uniref:outer membrane beta-barrel protein n=1 Tax=Paraflavitalea devenefica TaxID=2716334 RepID=UPI001420C212|nr:outer membrane beta-barrel protein [Paraflavitalea devenefica]NII27724.1 outer membrane beta-barrel protein [Paraflavitalea devenefica]
MSDHDFEKQVQLKMEQLRLRPSNAVWAGVEKNIRRDKRRRRMIIWIPLLLLFMGAGGYIALQGTSRSAKQDLVQQSTPASAASSTQNDNLSAKTSTQTPDHTTPAHPSKDNSSVPSGNQATGTTTGETAKAVLAPAGDHNQPSVAAHTADPVKTDKAVTIKRSETPVKKNTRKPVINDQARVYTTVIKHPVRKTKKDNPPVTHVPVITDKLADAQQQTTEQIDSAALAINNDTKQVDSAVVVSSVTADSSIAAVTGIDSAVSNSTVAATNTIDSAAINKKVVTASLSDSPVVTIAKVQPEKKKKSSKWQWGIQAEAGYSGVTDDGLFSLEKEAPVADLAAAPQFGGNTITYAPQFPRPVTKPSSITMGPAFSVGGFVQRTLSKRLSLSAGLQYSYLSSRMVVGSKVNSNRTVNRAPSTSQLVSSYYNGNYSQEYTNKYHFIELPITLHTRLNKGKRLPLVWDAGFSVSKLLTTTALHYDGLGGVYYEDNALFNKLQWAVSTGFNFGLFPQSKHPVMIGPMIRYNVSDLLKKDYAIGQYLWSAGLRASVLIKK